MKNTRIAAWLLFSAVLIFARTPSALAQPTNTNSQPAVATEKSPPIPEEARKHFVMGTTLFKDARTADDFSQVESEFKQAADLAPQWPEARYNLALTKEAAGDYSGAMADLKLYQQFKLTEAEARTVQDKIYVLEAKQKKAAAAAAKETEARAKADELAARKAMEEKRKLEEPNFEGNWSEQSGNDSSYWQISQDSPGRYSATYFTNGRPWPNLRCLSATSDGRTFYFKQFCYARADLREDGDDQWIDWVLTISEDGNKMSGKQTMRSRSGQGGGTWGKTLYRMN